MSSWDHWASQAATLEQGGQKQSLFIEEPVSLGTFVRDSKYLANPELSPEQFEAVRHIERIYLPEPYELLAHSPTKDVRDYWAMPCDMKNLITLEWGKGSGKDHICRIAVLRVSYLLL